MGTIAARDALYHPRPGGDDGRHPEPGRRASRRRPASRRGPSARSSSARRRACSFRRSSMPIARSMRTSLPSSSSIGLVASTWARIRVADFALDAALATAVTRRRAQRFPVPAEKVPSRACWGHDPGQRPFAPVSRTTPRRSRRARSLLAQSGRRRNGGEIAFRQVREDLEVLGAPVSLLQIADQAIVDERKHGHWGRDFTPLRRYGRERAVCESHPHDRGSSGLPPRANRVLSHRLLLLQRNGRLPRIVQDIRPRVAEPELRENESTASGR